MSPLKPIADVQKRWAALHELARENDLHVTRNEKGVYRFRKLNSGAVSRAKEVHSLLAAEHFLAGYAWANRGIHDTK